MRALLRGLGWVLNELVPAQAIRVALDRDYDYQVRKTAEAVADRDWYRERAEYLASWITAEQLAQVEEDQESLEPGQFRVPVKDGIPYTFQSSPNAVGEPAASPAGSGGEPVRSIPPDPGSPPSNPSVWGHISGGPW